MSGRTIGTFVGAAVGFVFPVVGVQLGAVLGGMIGGAISPDRFKGPSLGDIPLQTSQEGVPRPIIFGPRPPPFHGNVIQIGPVLHSTEDVEQDKGGPIIEEERVHQSYAIRICKGPAYCLKAWRDGKLVYDVTGTGDIDAESAEAASKLTFYIGDETQLPDPVLEALPAANGGGAGEVNAYRGTAYMVVDRDNLTGTGGRIPTWTFQMASMGTVTAGWNGVTFLAANDDLARKLATSLGGLDWDVPAESIATNKFLLYGGGILISAGSTGISHSADNGQSWTPATDDAGAAGDAGFGAYIGRKFWLPALDGGGVVTSVDGDHWTYVPIVMSGAVISVGGHPGLIVVGDNAGNVRYSTDGGATWAAQANVAGTNYINTIASDGSRVVIGISGGIFAWTTDGISWGSQDLFGDTGEDKRLQILHTPDGWIAAYSGGGIAVSATGTSWSVVSGTTSIPGFGIAYGAGVYVVVGFGALIYSSTDTVTWTSEPNNLGSGGVTIETVVAITCPGTELPDAPGYYVADDGTICGPVRDSIATGVTYLSEVELEIARLCGIPASKMDVSEITAIEVEGYLIGKQMTGSDALRPLAMLHFHTLPEYDGQIHAALLGGPSVVTLTDDDFVDAPEEDDEIRAQAIELPRKLNLYFADPDAEFATVPAPAERFSRNVQASSLMSVEAPMTLTRAIATQKADVLLKIIWEEAQGRLKRELPAFKYSFLTDADAFHYDDKRWRIERMETLETTIRIEAVRDRISNLTSYATAADSLAPTPQPRTLRGDTKFQAWNGPRLRTQDDKPGIYVAGTGILAGWQGYDLYISVDNGVTEQRVLRATGRATMGYLTDDITASQDDSNGPIPLFLYDDRTITSITDSQMQARLNAFVLVSNDVAEVAQVKTVDEISNGDFELTDVDRGQLGTDAAPHFAGDKFVLLDSGVYFIPLDASLAGKTLILRPVSIGTAPENNDTYTLVFAPQFTGPEVIEYLVTGSGEFITTDTGEYIRVT